MKRGGPLARRTPLKRTPLRSSAPAMRRTSLPKFSKRRSGMSAHVREELRELHRAVVMIRAGCAAEDTGTRRDGTPRPPKWWGCCERCGEAGYLYTCHIEPVGQFPALRFDHDNAWAGCYRCHIHWWHKSPREAERWIVEKLGKVKREALALRAMTAKKLPDPSLIRLHLIAERSRLQRVSPE